MASKIARARAGNGLPPLAEERLLQDERDQGLSLPGLLQTVVFLFPAGAASRPRDHSPLSSGQSTL